MTKLTLDSVTKQFTDDDGVVVAVDDVSIDVADGEFLVLVGPSGCGKSTTLRMIAGLESVTSGRISLGDRVINDLQPKDRNIAMVFQNYALYPHMTVRGNMAFGLEESTDLSDDEIDSKVREAAEMMGIEPLLDRKPRDLSGGQQQRVALGRAIVRDPAVFLMDEPLSNLDAKLRAEMRIELQRIQAELGVTTVYVTHDQTEAMTMSDRIAILDGGELQQVGPPMEIYHEPVNVFVAGFIGDPSMNFFEMRREGDRLAAAEFAYPLSPQISDALGDATAVTLGVRPEDVVIVPEVSGEHEYEVTVDVVEPLGDENLLYLTFSPEETEPQTFVATIGGMQRVSAGDRVVARLPESAVHLFETDTGAALRNRTVDDVDTLKLP